MLTSIYTILFVLFIYVTLGFIISIIIKRNDIADVMWGPGIFLAAITAYYLNNSNSYLLLFLISLWAMRIFLHIGNRFVMKKEEDFRYATWRTTWKNFYLRSYLQIFLLQGFLMFMVASSVIIYSIYNIQNASILFFAGISIALFGLVFETFADRQLKSFLKTRTPENKDEIMQAGLWKYTRHPNYFGEVTFWWGIFISCLSFSSPIYINLLLLVSPATITFLILYVSGIPMLEKKYENNAAFQIYKSRTPAFFPKFF